MIRFQRFLVVLFASALVCIPQLRADPVPVRYPQGTSHGFLVLRDTEDKLLATGDFITTVHGRRLTIELIFHFRDGSLDDDVATFTQDGVFRLLHEHHVQRGPSYPSAVDMTVDVPTGQVELHETKDGKEKVTKQHMDLPPDLVNGLLLTEIENLSPTSPTTTFHLLVPYNGAKLIQLMVTPAGTTPFRAMGGERQAERFRVKLQVGGVAGLVAPLIGKEPKDAEYLVQEGAAPAFVREEGQLFEDGPVWRIVQIGPTVQ